MNMNHSGGAPEDDFLARVRESAHAAVPASTLDLDGVLRSSRRKHATRRASVTLASTLALATVGAGAAGALPGIPGLWGSSPVEVAPIEQPSTMVEGDDDGEVDVDHPPPSPTALPSTDPEAQLAPLAPGVTSVAEPAAYRVDPDTMVLDLGLDAGGGDRYLAVVTLAKIDGRHTTTDLEVLAGGDTALANLRAGDLGGTLLWRGVTSDAMILPADGGPALVFGLSSAASDGDQFLVFDDPQTDGSAGAQGAPAAPGPESDAASDAGPQAGSSLPVTPFDVLGDGNVWMRALQVDRATAEPRGFVYSDEGTWSASWCRSTSPECAVIHDVKDRSVDTPRAAAPTPLVAELAPLLADDPQEGEVPAMEVCVSERTGTSWTAPEGLTGETFAQAPQGVDADVWRLCLIDLSEASGLASEPEAPPKGHEPPSQAPSDEPSTAPEDEDPLGLGGLLEGLFGG